MEKYKRFNEIDYSKYLLTRLAVENLFHPFQPFILGQKALAPKVTRKMYLFRLRLAEVSGLWRM